MPIMPSPILNRLRELKAKFEGDTTIKGIATLCFSSPDEIQELIVALEKRPADRAWYINKIDHLSRELAAAWVREAEMKYEESGEVWYWDHEGPNHLDSLTCNVLIPAQTLRDLLQVKEETPERKRKPTDKPLGFEDVQVAAKAGQRALDAFIEDNKHHIRYGGALLETMLRDLTTAITSTKQE